MSEDGGPAYPTTDDNYANKYSGPGLTVRDYFAGQALQGFLVQSLGTAMGSRPEIAAEYAYAIADAMLAERSKR